MTTELAHATALAGALLLAAAGTGHVRHPAALRAALHAQRALPDRLTGPVVAFTGPVQLAVAAAVLTTVLLAPPSAPVPLLAQATVYLGFAAHLWRVNRLRPGAPCGCFGTGEPVGWPVVVRAVLLCAGSLVAALSPGPATGQARLLALFGGVLLAMLAWLVSALRGAPRARRP